MKKIILILLFISAGVLLFDFFIVLGAATDRGEDPDNGNKGKYEKTSSTAEGENENKGKCENLSKKDKSKIEKKTSKDEKFYNDKYAKKIKAEREVAIEFLTDRKEKGEVDIDLVTGDYVIEGGLDKRTSLDSIQQALFFSVVVTNKKPAVVIYDTDGKEGVCEYRIRKAIEKINEETEKVGKAKIIEYCWVKVTNKSRMSGINRLRKYGWEDDCPWERKPKKKKK